MGARLALLVALAACHSATAVEGVHPDTLSAAGIEVVATGGIAALELHATIDSATGESSLTTTSLCAAGTTCPDVVPPSYRTLDRTEVDALFGRTRTPAFLALHADYGITPNGADMRTYVVTIRRDGTARTLRGDDGSLPALLAAFAGDVLTAPRGAVPR